MELKLTHVSKGAHDNYVYLGYMVYPNNWVYPNNTRASPFVVF